MKIPFSKSAFEYDRLPVISSPSDEHLHNNQAIYGKRAHNCTKWWILVLLALSVSIWGNVALLLRLHGGDLPLLVEEPGRLGPDTFYPEGRKIHNLFNPESPYNESKSEISDQAWKDLTPKKGGYIAVSDEDKERYRLPSTEMRDGEWIYGVSVFHQLHCLQMIRNGHYTTLAHQDHHDHSPDTQSEGRMHHYDHCFDFLRQALMCRPDTTLEPVTPAPNGLLADTGRGVVHSCRDYKDVLWFSGQYTPKNYPV
ncbi:hypothetical protein IFR05_009978 [Cadophora sp. M221]|nr:hypothetical protein IFR05_009978 [Cadophora sp. M221]